MSILNVNQIQPVGSGQTVTISATNISAGSATVTAGTFSGNLSSSGISTFSDTVNVGAGKSIRLYGATSGYSEIIAAAGSASTTFTLPANGGSASQYLQTDGSGGLSWQTVSTSNLTRGTAVATTSGTSIDFTNVPANVRRITLMYDQISFDTATNWQVQLGDSGGFETSGYYASAAYVFYNASDLSTGYQTGFVFGHSTIGFGCSGRMVIENLEGNTWVSNAITATGNVNSTSTSWTTYMSAGVKTLSDTLTQIRLTTISGTSTFDNGQVNVLYEV